MASYNSLLTLLSISLVLTSLISLSQAADTKLPAPTSLLFPIRKDPKTLQYYTTIEVSTRGSLVNVVLDLGGEFLWFDCSGYSLPSYSPIACGTSKCEAAKGSGGCVGCNGPARPGCTNNTCGASAYSPFSGILVSEGFDEEFFYGTSTNGRRLLNKYKSPNPFTFACSDYQPLYEGLASQAKGLVGLSRTSIALQTQFASAFSLARKFSLCIPSDSGLGSFFIGGGPYFVPPTSNEDLSKSLMNISILTNPVSTAPAFTVGDPSDEYFIAVQTIKIANEEVSFRHSLLAIDRSGVGGAKISTIAPYTELQSSIYKPFVRAFEKAASNKKIKKVTPVAPFGACFDSNTIGKTALTGPDVPVIDIVMIENAEWTIYGANSMVEVKKGVSCLAFVDGGNKPRTAIVLGGRQLENYLVEFDLGASKIGFSKSLLLQNTSCSQTRV